jgi:hypothetical protein
MDQMLASIEIVVDMDIVFVASLFSGWLDHVTTYTSTEFHSGQ